MQIEDQVKFWRESADEDYQAMEHLFASGHYAWCLFVGHLVIEKLLKAIYIKRRGPDFPHIHNLGILAQRAGLNISDQYKINLDIITRFNIEARYHNIKQSFYKKASLEFTTNALEIIQETRRWLLENL